jgi:hypothetical protein
VSPHHFQQYSPPQTDGTTERANITVKEMLHGLEEKDWEEGLPFVEFAFNNSKHASHGFKPFFLNYGQHPKINIVNELMAKQEGTFKVLQDTLQG